MKENQFLSQILRRMEDAPQRAFAEVWVKGYKHQLTWGDLHRRAGAFASAYVQEGVKPGDIIFVILRHSPDLYASYLGAMLLGAIPSFLPFPNSRQDTNIYWSSHTTVFQRTRAALLVTYRELASTVNIQLPGLTRVIVSDDVAGPDSDFPIVLVDEKSPALLQHSSGTTGLKKAVVLSYRAVRLQIEAYSKALDLKPDQSTIVSWLPLYHDMGLVACFLMPLYLDIPTISLDAFEWALDPTSLLDAIATKAGTHVWLPNFAYAHIARVTGAEARYNLHSVQAIIGCSEPNKPAIFDAFVQRFGADGVHQNKLQTCYAMAETVFAVTQSRLGITPKRVLAKTNIGPLEIGDGPGTQLFLSNGPPLDDMEVKVLSDGQLLTEGVVGEICVRAPYLFDGYFMDPITTGTSFVEGFFKTGDIGFIYEGEIYVIGRQKEIIIVNGRNFYASDVEMVVNQIDGVKKGRCAALAVYVPRAGTQQMVVVAERDGLTASDRAVAGSIAAVLNQNLGIAAGDVRLVEPGWLIKTTSGKVSRSENARKYVSLFRPEAEPSIFGEAG